MTVASQVAGGLKRLDELALQVPELAESVAFYKAVLPMLHQAQTQIEPLTLAPESIHYKLTTGKPILVGEELPLDEKAARLLFLRLCRIVESFRAPSNKKNGRNSFSQSFFARNRFNPLALIERTQNGDSAALRSAAAEQIRRAVEKNVLDLPAVWAATAAGDGALERLAVDHHLDLALLSLLAQNSLKPVLQAWVDGLTVDLEPWQRGVCPFCGSLPLFAEIQGKEGGRRLRCGLCGGDWPYPRLQCAFCNNRDYKTLGRLTVTGEEEKYHVQLCGQCNGYLKVVATFDPTPVMLLPVEDLATLHLDVIAVEHAYKRA